MDQFLSLTVAGLYAGAVYAITSSGLVLTYTTTGIFNIGHGAVGMLVAFVYWQMRVDWGWPAWASLPIAVLVVAPLLGLAVERLLMRQTRGAAEEAKLVVTIALTVALIGVSQTIWTSGEARSVPSLFRGKVRIFDVNVSYDQLLVILAALGVAAALRVFLRSSRSGRAMRALVDDEPLASLTGVDVVSVSRLSWVIGSMLASLAAVLLAPLNLLDAIVLTFLVVKAYAAAVVGRLRSITAALVGALALGLLENYAVGYLPDGPAWDRFAPTIPTVFLFLALLALPASRLEHGSIVGRLMPRTPTLRRSLGSAVAFVVLAMAVANLGSTQNLLDISQGLSFALLMLAIVVLTGLSGQVSLATLSFAGLGAWVFTEIGGVAGLAVAGLAAAPVAALVALPTMRLRGLYLALATFAFAAFFDSMVIQAPELFGGGLLRGEPISVAGFAFDTPGRIVVAQAIVFALAGIIVLAVRRSAWGRALLATRDSEVAVATVGLNVRWAKLAVFAGYGAMAGVAGAMFAASRGFASDLDFQPFQNLPLFLFAVVGGVTSVTGALLGGAGYAALLILQSREAAWVSGLLFVAIGAVAVGLRTQPGGAAGLLMGLLRRRPSVRAPEPAVRAAAESPAGGRTVARPGRWDTTPGPAVVVDGVRAAYGRIEVLHDVELVVPWGSVVAVVGPNGAGKTTLLRVLAGLMPASAGHVHLASRHVNLIPPHGRARSGICMVPERGGSFPSLTVAENLQMLDFTTDGSGPPDLEAVYEQFPVLHERRSQLAGSLSGGQRQMLALARAIATEPAILMIDEMSMGLAPMIVDDLYRVIRRMADEGTAVIVVEQFTSVLRYADFGALLLGGRIVDFDEAQRLGDRVAGAYLSGAAT